MLWDLMKYPCRAPQLRLLILLETLTLLYHFSFVLITDVLFLTYEEIRLFGLGRHYNCWRWGIG